MTDCPSWAAGPRRARMEAAQPITIGDNVWLGGGVIVLPR
jgi:maltose O-acetyltransferase